MNLQLKSILILFLSISANSFAQFTAYPIESLNSSQIIYTKWFDYDNDGDFDFITSQLSSSQIMLFENKGSNLFIPDSASGLGVGRGVAVTDNNHDGFLDVILNDPYKTKITSLLYNTGQKKFLPSNITLPEQLSGEFDWIDFDRDGKQDILFMGYQNNFRSVKFFRNYGSNLFLDAKVSGLEFIDSYYDIAFGDFDGNGYTDIVIGNGDYMSKNLQIYYNNGDKSFSLVDFGKYTTIASVSVCDYNSDGKPDIMVSAAYTYSNSNIEIFTNKGNGVFTKETLLLPAQSSSAKAKWCDFNNDGRVDILYGHTVYYNSGILAFSAANSFQLPTSATITGDYDNDGDVDLAINRTVDGVKKTFVAQNNQNPAVINITAPTGLNVEIIDDYAKLTWTATLINGKRATGYNLKIGTSPGGEDILSANVNANGKAKYYMQGNAGCNTFMIINKLPKGTIYWSVQAFDFAGNGGVFSAEASFVNNTQIQAKLLTAKRPAHNFIELAWERGNGDSCIVFIEKGNSLSSLPSDGTNYPVVNDLSALGNGIHCVYKGTCPLFKVNGLEPYTEYTFAVFEYDNNPTPVYNTSINDNLHTAKTSLFKRMHQPGISHIAGKAKFADFDNDGDLDYIIAGRDSLGTVIKFFINDGVGNFSEKTATGIKASVFEDFDLGDFNNDGRIDIAVTGYESDLYSNTIYRNDGNFNFTYLEHVKLANLDDGRVTFGDYDNDGDLDIIQNGFSFNSAYTYLYDNLGNEKFAIQTQHNFTRFQYNDLTWADMNNDGHLDLFFPPYGELVLNKGNKTFHVDTINNYRYRNQTSVDWIDFDADGYLDFAVSGVYSPNYIPSLDLFRNISGNNFEPMTKLLPDTIVRGKVAWGDYNNDGYPDLLAVGEGHINSQILLLQNNKNGGFIQDAGFDLDLGTCYSLNCADIDDDGDLDFLVSIVHNYSRYTYIYENLVQHKNRIPQAPNGLSHVQTDSLFTLNWQGVSSDETPGQSLSYNVRIGTSPGGTEALSPHSGLDGFRELVKLGNCMLDTFKYFKPQRAGTYYWSVQAIDNNFAGGAFAPEQSFTYYPQKQAFDLQVKSKTTQTALLNWQRGQGDSCIVFAMNDTTAHILPENGKHYTAESLFGEGSKIEGSNWYCVYKGTADTVTLTGLSPLNYYKFMVLDYNHQNGAPDYFTETSEQNIILTQTDLFDEMKTDSILGLYESYAEWGDYNNDGFADLLLTGTLNGEYYYTLLYENINGTGFTEKFRDFRRSQYMKATWIDFNSDNKLDIFIFHYNFTDTLNLLYQNNGDGSFTKLTDFVYGRRAEADAAWTDFDNDGDIDMLAAGYNEAKQVDFFENINGKLTRQSAAQFPYSYSGAVAHADYNNDGKTDVLINGYDGKTRIIKLFKNEGSNYFAEQSGTVFNSLNAGNSSWADCNNDGYLDLLINGGNNTGSFCELYLNNGDGTFSKKGDLNIKGTYYGNSGWLDYNNDGEMDIVITGYNTIDRWMFLHFYAGDGKGNFTRETGIQMPGVNTGHISWADIDNDTDLDFVITGYDGGARISKIYINQSTNKNTAPYKPLNPVITETAEGMLLSWEAATDIETNPQALTYNITVSDSSGNFADTYHFSPMADLLTGKRLVVEPGNVFLNKTFTIKKLPKGNYRFMVQAIDNSYAGGEFAVSDLYQYNGYTGLNIKDSFDIAFYPNPVKDFLIVESLQYAIIIELFNIHGQLMHTETMYTTKTKIHVASWPNGIYLLRYKSPNGKYRTQKVLKYH